MADRIEVELRMKNGTKFHDSFPVEPPSPRKFAVNTPDGLDYIWAERVLGTDNPIVFEEIETSIFG